MKKNIIVGVALLIVLSLGAFFLFFQPTIPVKTNKKDEEEKKTSTQKEKIYLGYKFKAGEHFIYDINYTSKVKIIDTKKKTESNTLMTIAGKLHQKIYEVKSKSVFVGYYLKLRKFSFPNSNPKTLREVGMAFETEIYTAVSHKGTIQKWYWPKNLRGDLRNYMKTLLLYYQLVLPNKVLKGDKWRTIENDIVGVYFAKYSFKRKKGQDYIIEITKKKLKYADKREHIPQIITSVTNALFWDSKAHIVSLKTKEIIKQEAMGNVTHGTVTLEMKFLKKISEILPEISDNLLNKKKFQTSISSKIEGREIYRKNRLKKIVGDMKWPDFMKRFGALKPKSYQKNYDVFHKLVAWMELNPDKLHLASKQILISKNATLAVQMMLDALGKVPHPKAQEILGSIIRKRRDNKDIVVRAIISIGDSTKPTTESVKLLQNIYRTEQDKQIHGTASFALGSVAKKLAHANPSEAAAVVSDLEKTLQGTQDRHKKMVLLESLGNAGSNSSLPYISNYLSAKDDTVRATAVIALRFIQNPQVDRHIAKMLTTDSAYSVRVNAVDAIRYRKPTPELFSALRDTLAKEKSEELRIREAVMIWKMRKLYPSAEAIVRKYAASDPSKKVRKKLQSLLR